MDIQQLGDKGLSIFVFAAYQQLTSGESVSAVSVHDNTGHAADPQGLRDIEAMGLARIESDRAVFSDAGLALLDELLAALRAAGGKARSGRAFV